jgi:hypothetical protein
LVIGSLDVWHTSLTAMRRGHERTSASLSARATGLRAFTPFRKGTAAAIHGASKIGAILRRVCSATSDATVFRLHHRTSTGRNTLATSERAVTPVGPFVLHAINGAFEISATLRVAQIRASGTVKNGLGGGARRIVEFAVVTVGQSNSHVTSTSHGTGTTSERAIAERAPGTNFTMDRAGAVVAVNSLLARTASLTTVLRLNQSTSLHVCAGTARLTANSSSVVIRHIPLAFNAVLGTAEHVARLEISSVGACSTAEGRLDERTDAHLHAAGATRGTASTPYAPRANTAIDRASLRVARLGLETGTAGLATVLRLSERTSRGLAATSTRQSA